MLSALPIDIQHHAFSGGEVIGYSAARGTVKLSKDVRVLNEFIRSNHRFEGLIVHKKIIAPVHFARTDGARRVRDRCDDIVCAIRKRAGERALAATGGSGKDKYPSLIRCACCHVLFDVLNLLAHLLDDDLKID